MREGCGGWGVARSTKTPEGVKVSRGGRLWQRRTDHNALKLDRVE